MLDIRQAEQLVYGATLSVPSTEQANRANRKSDQFAAGQKSGPVTRGRLLTEQQTPPEVPAGLPSSLLERSYDVPGSGANLSLGEC